LTARSTRSDTQLEHTVLLTRNKIDDDRHDAEHFRCDERPNEQATSELTPDAAALTAASTPESSQPRAVLAAIEPLIIAVDGPSGAGKSTLGRRLASKLKLLYLDTGAMYRAVALAVLRAKLDPHDAASVALVAQTTRIELAGEAQALQVRLDGEDVSSQLRKEEIAHIASIISTNSDVRREMVRRQREMAHAAARGSVLDGRDIGTVVFPDAPVKFFLTATPEQRAARRFTEAADAAGYDEVLRDIQERDARDSTRDDSPLAIADDAIVIDSTEETIDEVLARMLEAVAERRMEVNGE
jgi:cytidylate kinase